MNFILDKTTAIDCVFVIGEDFFNIDNINNTTTKGTPQETDMSFYEMFDTGLTLMKVTIQKLVQKFERVHMIMIAGNHDRTIIYPLAKALALKYEGEDWLTIDCSTLKRKYISIGKTLIGLGHLDTEQKNMKQFLMQNEVKEHYGKSKFNYFVSGHFHNYSVEEIGGISYIRLPSLSGKDNWHNDMGYITSVKGAIGLEFSEDRGLIGKIIYNVVQEDEQ